MGLEAECAVEWRGETARGKALLETAEILFRGELRLKIPRDRITAAVTEGGALRVTIRPKGHAEVSEAKVRAAARGAGLVDVKVASFSPTHTAERFVIPVAARAASAARKKPTRKR